MKISLRQIPQGDTLHIEGEEDSSVLELEEANAAPVGPLRYALDIGLSEGGLFATGRIAQRVRMTCVACLEPFEEEIVSDRFAIQIELEGNETVDLTPEIREDMHLLLPAHPRCDLGGEKICPAQFPRDASYSSVQTTLLEWAGRPAVWAALDKLNTLPSDGSPKT